MSRIIGIDLGTSTSEAAVIVDGKPVLIPNLQGEFITPSVVYIGSNGETLVGEPAREYLFTRPESTFMEVKRLTGSDTKLTVNGMTMAPEEIQALLLKYLADCARKFLGEKVDRAVITVPAYFNDVQRRMTARAGELAGLSVERIINEPTAAAMDYGMNNLSESKYILVFDLGGGTLDVTVLELFEGVVDVKASGGNNALGGKDFDEVVMKQLAQRVTDPRSLMRLKAAAEQCKIALSDDVLTHVSLPFLLTGIGSSTISIERDVKRSEFDKWTLELIDAMRAPVERALGDAGLNASDIGSVLLVGGSTKMPSVRSLVAKLIGVDPSQSIDPDLAVARGAAIMAGILEGTITGDQALVLTDVCPFTLGTSVINRNLDVFGHTLRFVPIINRNTTIPVERTQIFYPAYDQQRSVLIDVYQGDAADPEDNDRLGEVTMSLDGIRAGRATQEAIEVTYAYDVNGILQVKGRLVSTGKLVETTINTVGVTPLEPVDITKWMEHPDYRKYRPILRKAERLLDDLEEGVNSDGEQESAPVIEQLVQLLKEALVLGNDDKAEQLRDELTSLL